jgi:hypothetical protein
MGESFQKCNQNESRHLLFTQVSLDQSTSSNQRSRQRTSHKAISPCPSGPTKSIILLDPIASTTIARQRLQLLFSWHLCRKAIAQRLA